MLPTSEEIIARLEAARARPPSLDKGAVEAAFQKHFRALELDPLPVHWVPDAVEGYILASESLFYLILDRLRHVEDTSAFSRYSSAVRNECEIIKGLILLTERSKLDALERTESLTWRAEDALALRAARQEAATRTHESPKGTAGRVSHNNLFFAEQYQQIAAMTATLAAYWPTVAHSIMKAEKYLPPGIKMKDMEPYKIYGYEIWKPFVDAFEAGLWLYWVLKDGIWAVLRPIIHSSSNRLHCETGPAVHWPGGASLWFYKGIRVTEQIILHPETLTVDQIFRERNIEVRRVMIERFGADRLIREAKAAILDQSSWGTLYALDLDDDEPLVMVEVTCPSTQREYMLRVPPDMTTAQRAVAWTFDLRAENYQPAQQT